MADPRKIRECFQQSVFADQAVDRLNDLAGDVAMAQFTSAKSSMDLALIVGETAFKAGQIPRDVIEPALEAGDAFLNAAVKQWRNPEDVSLFETRTKTLKDFTDNLAMLKLKICEQVVDCVIGGGNGIGFRDELATSSPLCKEGFQLGRGGTTTKEAKKIGKRRGLSGGDLRDFIDCVSAGRR